MEVLKFLYLLTLLQLSVPALAIRKTSTLNLASMRIYTAKSQLKETGVTGALLEAVCKTQLESVQNGLTMSQSRIAEDPDDAKKELITVGGYLESCIKTLGNDKTTEIRDAYAVLEKVGQSVSSAINLIDQSVPTAEELTQEILEDENFDKEPDPETGAAMADDEDASQSSLSTGMDDKSKSGPQGTLSLLPLPPTINALMDEMHVDYCPSHVELRGTSAAIRLDRGCGGKFHTQSKYPSGVFTVRMKAPSLAAGISNSFYISSNDDEADMISFDLIGSLPNRVLTSYAVNGNHAGTLETFHMDFDTSLHFHEYTVKWDEDSIVWMVDNVVIRTLRASHVRAFPKKAGHVYGYTWDASYVGDGKWAGEINWENGPFFMYYNDLQITTPISPGQWQPPPQAPLRRNVPVHIHPVVIDYCASNIEIHQDSSMAITFDRLGCGGRIRSLTNYASGRFKGNIKCPEGETSGLLTSMYVSSCEGSKHQDEIDFEFLGDNKRIVQTNFYVNGIGGHEQWVELDFDCSQAFHSYAIHYSKHKIQWFVDQRLVRTVLREQQMEQQKPYPAKKVFLYASVWNASWVNNGLWTGKWRGSGLPYVAKFNDITIEYP